MRILYTLYDLYTRIPKNISEKKKKTTNFLLPPVKYASFLFCLFEIINEYQIIW